jgi:hypothetical protein
VDDVAAHRLKPRRTLNASFEEVFALAVRTTVR